ncbi:MAG: hypothetical protein IJN28_00695, partial [Selenomonadales bacterium]|nr:hypothetical protein [Selenomonadales bacterium]
MKALLFEKRVDQSLLKSGLTIPKSVQNTLLDVIGIRLSKGEKESIQVVVGENKYEAIITNVNFRESVTDREVVQIRYSEGSAICQELKRVFLKSMQYIASGQGNILSTEGKEYVEVYAIGEKTLEFKCYPDNSVKKEFLKYIGNKDSLAGYSRSYKLVLYKDFFSLMDDSGSASGYKVAEAFRNFYVD